MTACVRMLRGRGAGRIVVAVPVGSPRSLRELEREADEVIALAEPASFRAVGQFYDRFDQVSDEEAIATCAARCESGRPRAARSTGFR